MTPELAALKSNIEDAIEVHLPGASVLAQPLIEAMRYAALSGGKRLRPMLVCATCTGLGGILEDALAPACAVEFMHAYSLIHDDLPAMDDDALRHGLPSCHIAHGEATAILAGDALQTLAFETLANSTGIGAELKIEAIQLLSHACGWEGMVGGQSYDLAAEGAELSLSQLQTLHAAKTGALIKASIQIGAMFANVADERFVLVSEFADRIGLAFQIVDDVLDVTQTTEELGKPAGSDAQANKSTFTTLMGVSQATETANSLLAEALPMLERAGINDDRLAELGTLAVHRSY